MKVYGEGAGNNLRELNQLMSMTSALNQQLLCAVEKLQSGEGNRVLASKGGGHSYLMMKY